MRRKIFLRREVDCAGVIVREKSFPRDIAVVSSFLAAAKIVTAQKPLIHRHFRITSIFAQKIARAESFSQRRCACDAVARRLRKPDRAVTHKI
jgi:hypothetical protein